MSEQQNLQNDNLYTPSTQDFSTETKSWAEIIRIAIDQWVRNNLNVWVPVQVVKVNNNSSVNVQILLQEIFNVQGAVTLPPLQNVPVEHPRGANWGIKLPVAVGDYGRVTFCDRSLDKWKVAGGGPLNPKDARMHHLSDALFIPGFYPLNNIIEGEASQMILQNGESEFIIGDDGTFELTNGEKELLDLLGQLAGQLSTLATTTSSIATALETFATAAGSDAGLALVAPATAAAAATLAAALPSYITEATQVSTQADMIQSGIEELTG